MVDFYNSVNFVANLMDSILNLSFIYIRLTERPMVIFVIFMSTLITNYFFMTTKNNQFVFILFSLYWLCFGFWAIFWQVLLKDIGIIFHIFSFPIIILTYSILLEELKDNFHD